MDSGTARLGAIGQGCRCYWGYPLEDVYEQTHQLDLLTQRATTAVMDAEETAQRQRAKQAVDAAHEEIRRLHDEVEP